MTEHPSEEDLSIALFEGPSGEVAAHLRRCPSCAAQLEALRRTLGAVDALPPPALAPAHVESLRQRVHASLAPARDWATGAVTATVALLAFVFLADAPDALRWALALAAALGATMLATQPVRSRSDAWLGVGLALAGSLALAAFDVLGHGLGRGGELGEHYRCEYIVSFVAAAPLMSACFFARRGTDPVLRALRGATGASAGALAGQAALLTTCSSPEGFLHVTVFHVCAVLGATLVGAIVGRALPPLPASG